MTHDKKGPVALLKQKLEETGQSCKTYQEQYLRALADFDNYRKRVERDAEQSRRLALERLITDLLPVLDNFERAVQAVGGEREADSVRTGMELIHRQLRDALCKHGLEEYSCVGAEFDPRRAEAVSFTHTDEHKPGTVVSETCKGYSCGERVLRPAKVVVAKEPERSQKSEARSRSAEVAEGEPGEIAEPVDESNEDRIEE